MLTGVESVEQSSAIRARVEKARKLQHARFHDSKLACNADMGPAEVRQYCELDEVSRSLLRSVGTWPAPCERALRPARGRSQGIDGAADYALGGIGRG